MYVLYDDNECQKITNYVTIVRKKTIVLDRNTRSNYKDFWRSKESIIKSKKMSL